MEKRASLEIIAPSVEEAIAQGLADLGLSEEAVEIDVLDAGSRGLFGIGSRQARIRLTIKSKPSDGNLKDVSSQEENKSLDNANLDSEITVEIGRASCRERV